MKTEQKEKILKAAARFSKGLSDNEAALLAYEPSFIAKIAFKAGAEWMATKTPAGRQRACKGHRIARNRPSYEELYRIEKARADNLQAELEGAEDALSALWDGPMFLRINADGTWQHI